MIDFKKKLIFIFYFFCFSTWGTHLIVTDNENLSQQINSYFSDKQITEKEIKKFLFQNNYYKSEVQKREGGKYFIKNPMKIIFIIEGNNFFTEKEIRKIIKIDKNKTGFYLHNFLTKIIKNFYLNEGFLKIEIDKKIITKQWKEWIYLTILEGERIRIAKISVKGVFSKSNSVYEKFIKNNSTNLIRKGFYSKEGLEVGYKNLVNELKRQGYFQSKIYAEKTLFKDDKVFIVINLEEGPLVLIKDIQIKNNQNLPLWEILSHIKSRVHQAFQIDVLQEDLKRLEQLYKSKGYLQMQIVNKEDVVKYIHGERYAFLDIKIKENSRAFISKISIKGLRRVKETKIRNLLKFQTGDIFTPLKREEAIAALSATGLFIDINLNEKIVDDNKFEIEVLLNERKFRSLKGGLGLNSERGLTTRAYSEIIHRNLFGWGRALVVRGSGKVNLNQLEKFLEYEISGLYKEVFSSRYDYRGDINISQSKNIFHYARENINYVRKNQISFFINKKINKDLEMKWNLWSFENRREACTKKECPENTQRIGATSFIFTLDTRDNIFNPVGGILSSFQTELALPVLGSSLDISFLKFDFQNELYWSFLKYYALGVAFKTGSINTLGESEYLPVSQAFILGGQNSLRGYDGNIEGERIPSQKQAPIKTANESLQIKTSTGTSNVLSSYYGLLNLNFRFPLIENFKGVLFYDIGAVHLSSKNQKLTSYGHSLGIGFRYQTFLIPVGLDIAYKMPPKEGSVYRFHFSIGW